MADYPNNIFTQRELENLPGIAYNPADKKTLFAEDMQALGAEVTALEQTLGTNPEGDIALTVKERISRLENYVLSNALFLSQTGRATLDHDDDFNLSAFALVFEASASFGYSNFLLGKGDFNATFHIRVQINAAGDVIANMINSAQTISATASGALSASCLRRVKITYDDAGDRKLRIFVNDVLQTASAAFTTVPLIFNSDDFILDIGAGACYITRFGLSSNLDWAPTIFDYALDDDVVFFFPMDKGDEDPESVVGNFTLDLNAHADVRPVPNLLLPVDVFLRGLFNIANKQIGSRFWWDKDDFGPAALGLQVLDWEASSWLYFSSVEDEDPQVVGDFNFQTKQRLAAGAILGGPVRLKGYTVAGLPAGVQGDRAFVTNALSPTWGATVVGGGSAVVPVFYNGTNWIVA